MLAWLVYCVYVYLRPRLHAASNLAVNRVKSSTLSEQQPCTRQVNRTGRCLLDAIMIMPEFTSVSFSTLGTVSLFACRDELTLSPVQGKLRDILREASHNAAITSSVV